MSPENDLPMAGIMAALLLAIASVVILHWFLPAKPRCQDVHSSPQLRGSIYDRAMGQCEEPR